MSGEKGPGISSFNNPEVSPTEREQSGPSSDSDIIRQHESIVTALGWVYATPHYYSAASSKVLNRRHEPGSEYFDDTLGENTPSGAVRDEAEQDVWQYGLNKAGVSIEEMYVLAAEAGRRAWPELDD